MIHPRTIEILLVEDNPADVDLTREAVTGWKFPHNLNVVSDGVEAMDYLRKEGSFADALTPDLVMLDLNLPKKDGRDVLKEIKSDHLLQVIPVIIVSSSDADFDIIKSYKLGANCYIVKPIGIEKFMETVQIIGDFWFYHVRLPSRLRD